MDVLSLLSLNWNIATIVGILVAILIIIYFIIRFALGFVNPFNVIDRLVILVAIITGLMVWGYSIFENVLYTTLGQIIFFGTLFLVLMYFILFYGKSSKSKKSKNTKKSSSYTNVVFNRK